MLTKSVIPSEAAEFVILSEVSEANEVEGQTQLRRRFDFAPEFIPSLSRGRFAQRDKGCAQRDKGGACAQRDKAVTNYESLPAYFSSAAQASSPNSFFQRG